MSLLGDGAGKGKYVRHEHSTGEMILPTKLEGLELGAVMREVRIKGERTRYQVEQATGGHYVKKVETEGFSTIQLRTLLRWCEICDFEVVLRPLTREKRVNPKKLKGDE